MPYRISFFTLNGDLDHGLLCLLGAILQNWLQLDQLILHLTHRLLRANDFIQPGLIASLGYYKLAALFLQERLEAGEKLQVEGRGDVEISLLLLNEFLGQVLSGFVNQNTELGQILLGLFIDIV